MIVLKDLLLMVSKNRFCIVLLLMNHQAITFIERLELNYLRNFKKMFHLISFCLGNDDHKPVNKFGKTISCTCQLVKIEK